MGIQGLLPFLKKSSVQCNVRQFKGQTVAIDSYCWLHRGAFACAEKLALGEKTDQYVYYCLKYLNTLLANDIKPIMVFDGCRLPSKHEVEKTRRERRDANRKKAAEHLREGRRAEARDCLTQCIDITPLMALELMKACREKGVDCIVAPYEADAQLAYLNKIGLAQVIITEDSDLILFGCDKILFKMDMSGNGILIEKEKLNLSFELPMEVYDFDKCRRICILSGCDYLPSLPGIGLSKATKIFKLSRQSDIRQVIRKLPSTLKMPNLPVTEQYIEAFIKAENTFLYQLVYNPSMRRILPLTSYPPHIDPADLKYAGPSIDEERALQIALGNINVNTGEIICDYNPDLDGRREDSVWNKEYRIDESNLRKKAEICLDDLTTTTRGKQLVVNIPNFKLKHIDKSGDMKTNMDLLTHSYDSHSTDNDNKLLRLDDENKYVAVASPARKKTRTFSPRALTDTCVEELADLVPQSSDVILKNCAEKGDLRADISLPLVLSPKRNNIFALKKVEEKTAFSLHISPPNQVKSRFFTSTKPKQETLFLTKLKEQDTDILIGTTPENVRTRILEPVNVEGNENMPSKIKDLSPSILPEPRDPIGSKLSVFRREKKLEYSEEPKTPINSSVASLQQFVNVRPRHPQKPADNSMKLISDENPLPAHINIPRDYNMCNFVEDISDNSLKTPDQSPPLNYIQLNPKCAHRRENILLDEDPFPESCDKIINYLSEDPLCDNIILKESSNLICESPRGGQPKNLQKNQCRTSGLKKSKKKVASPVPISKYFQENFAHKRRSLPYIL